MEIKAITAEEQEVLIQQKLDERIKFNLLAQNAESEDLLIKNRALLYKMCEDTKTGFQFFANNFLWIEDPQVADTRKKEIPFLLWDYQEKVATQIIDAIIGGYDLPIEKCRKLGLSWLVLAIATWGMIFHQWDGLLGSNKEENVDKRGDMGALFEKVRYMIQRLPDWIYPNKEAEKQLDKHMLIRHPIHKASLVGEATNPNFGRSDRKKFILLDEFSSWDNNDKNAYQGCSATTFSRIPLSTPNARGTNCYFYEVIKDHKKKNKPVLTLPWTLHPVFAKGIRPTTEDDLAWIKFQEPFTSPWLEAEIERAATVQEVAQEILINYDVAMTGKVFSEFNDDINIDETVEYDPNLPLYINWDFGLDSTAIQWIQPNARNNTFNIIDEYVNTGVGSGTGSSIYHYLEVVESKQYKQGIHFGDPHSGENRSITSGQSPATILRRAGYVFRSQRTPIKTRIQAARSIIKQVRVSPLCQLSIEMFKNWQMVRPKTGNRRADLPDHSEHSHIGEAFCYFAFNYKNPKRSSSTNQKKKNYSSISGVI